MTCSVQVPFFLFVVFVVYTLLPFSMWEAVTAGLVSSASHLLVLAILAEAFTNPNVHLGLQVRGTGPAKPRVGLWFGLRAAEAGVGELEALGTEVC